MKLSSSSERRTTGVQERLGKSGKKERLLALVLATIGAISAGVSAGCEPIVAGGYGRYTTPDGYIRARKRCSHLRTGDERNYRHDRCMMEEIDNFNDSRKDK